MFWGFFCFQHVVGSTSRWRSHVCFRDLAWTNAFWPLRRMRFLVICPRRDAQISTLQQWPILPLIHSQARPVGFFYPFRLIAAVLWYLSLEFPDMSAQTSHRSNDTFKFSIMPCSQAVKSRTFQVGCWAWAAESDRFNTKIYTNEEISNQHQRMFLTLMFWTSMFLSANTDSVTHHLNIFFS